jgi:hypothetical protein
VNAARVMGGTFPAPIVPRPHRPLDALDHAFAVIEQQLLIVDRVAIRKRAVARWISDRGLPPARQAGFQEAPAVLPEKERSRSERVKRHEARGEISLDDPRSLGSSGRSTPVG